MIVCPVKTTEPEDGEDLCIQDATGRSLEIDEIVSAINSRQALLKVCEEVVKDVDVRTDVYAQLRRAIAAARAT